MHVYKNLARMNWCLTLFDDKRLLTLALFIWTCVSSLVFTYIMLKDNSNFLLFGPNKHNKLLGVPLDDWFKWWITAIYTFVSTAIAAFAGDSLLPFINNTIQDHKTEYIPYSKFTCLCIIQIFTVYAVIMSVIGMFVALTQVDFMLIRILADILVNHYTTFWFLRGKKVDPNKYELWKAGQHGNSSMSHDVKFYTEDIEMHPPPIPVQSDLPHGLTDVRSPRPSVSQVSGKNMPHSESDQLLRNTTNT